MAVIRSVSLTKEHDEMIKKEGLSISMILRRALDDIYSVKSGELLDSNSSLMKKVERISETNQKLVNFIEERGLIDVWLQKS